MSAEGYAPAGQRLLYAESLPRGRIRNHFTPTFAARRPPPVTDREETP